MIKYSGIFSVVLGIVVNLVLFVDVIIFAIGFTTVIPAFILSFIGVFFAILGFIKVPTNYSHLLCIIGGMLNISPVVYFILLFFSLG